MCTEAVRRREKMSISNTEKGDSEEIKLASLLKANFKTFFSFCAKIKLS